MVDPFLQQKPCLAQDWVAVDPQQSAVGGALFFTALHTSTFQALPLMDKLEEINECLDTEAVVGYSHRGHHARVTDCEVFSCSGGCLRPGAATTVVEDVVKRNASVAVILH